MMKTSRIPRIPTHLSPWTHYCTTRNQLSLPHSSHLVGKMASVFESVGSTLLSEFKLLLSLIPNILEMLGKTKVGPTPYAKFYKAHTDPKICLLYTRNQSFRNVWVFQKKNQPGDPYSILTSPFVITSAKFKWNFLLLKKVQTITFSAPTQRSQVSSVEFGHLTLFSSMLPGACTAGAGPFVKDTKFCFTSPSRFEISFCMFCCFCDGVSQSTAEKQATDKNKNNKNIIFLWRRATQADGPDDKSVRSPSASGSSRPDLHTGSLETFPLNFFFSVEKAQRKKRRHKHECCLE